MTAHDTPHPAPAPARTRRPRAVVGAAVALLAPVTVAAVRAYAGPDVPDPVATHWDLHGRVDDTMPVASLWMVTQLVSTLAALAAVAATVCSRHERGDRLVVGALTWLAWLAAVVLAGTLLVARGAHAAADVRLGVGDSAWLVAVPLVPTLLALLAGRLHPQDPPGAPRRTRPVPATPVRLAPNERAAWVGRSSSAVLVAVAGVLLLVAVWCVFTVWPVANLLALLAVVVFWAHVVTVRVDDAGLTVAWGPLRFPRVTVPLDRVVAARAEEVRPVRWGGWGYRLTRRGTAVVTRRGPGLLLERTDGSAFVVTVDDADTAADLVNALLERRLAGRRG